MARRSIRRALVVAVLTLLLSPVTFARDELPKRAQRHVEAADDLLGAGDASGAIRRLENARRVAGAPSFDVLVRLARAHFELGRYRETVNLAAEAHPLAEEPAEQAELAYLAGRSYFESAFLAGSEVDPERVEEVWEQSMDRAEGFLLNAAATAPEAIPEARYFLGRIYQARREVDAAERFYGDYLTLLPEGAFAASATARMKSLENPGGGPLEVEGDMVPPVRIFSPQPEYTLAARKARVQGVVVVEAVISEEGEVVDAQLRKDLPLGLGQAAVSTLRRWRFKPALLEGEPVAVVYTLTVGFSLQR